MNKSLVRTAMCGCAGVVAAGCLQDQRPAQHPELALVDSVMLEQSDSEYVGLPSGFAVLPGGGGFLVSDLRNRTVHRFGRDGTHQEQLGRAGEGPGEFPAPPTALALDGDSILFVRTGWAGLQVIDLRTRTFRDPWELPGTAHVIAASNGRLYFRLVDPETRTSVGVLASGSDSIGRGGPYPAPLAEYPILALAPMSMAAVGVVGPDSVAVALQTSDYVFWGTLERQDSIRVPAIRRQGSRPDLLQEIALNPEEAGPDIVYTPSLPVTVARMSAARLAVVFDDLQLTEDRRFIGESFLSVVDTGLRRVCPDAPIPVLPDSRPPLTAIRGDTLFTLGQDVRGVEAVVAVRMYVVRTETCRWRS